MNFLFYFAVAVTAIFVIKLILMMFGIGNDGDINIDVDTDVDFSIDGDVDMDMSSDGLGEGHAGHFGHGSPDTDADFSFVLFTLDSVLAFLMVFSWSTLYMLQEMFFPAIISVLIGFVLGMIVMVLYAYLLSKIKGLETNEVEDVFPDLDAEGIMYLSSKNGRGQAKFSVNGKFIIYDVYTSSEQLSTGDIVRVQNINNKMISVIKKD